jgi:IS5 family transposase
VIVDSTVQHKAIAHPTDSRLLETARTKLVEAAKDAGIDLKQTFAKEGRHLSRKAARYAHARQFKRMRRAIRRQRTIVGRLQREIERKASAIGSAVREALDGKTLDKAVRINAQSGQRKAADGQPKLYAWHAPGSGVHQQGQGQAALRVRGQGGHCQHAQRQPDRGRAGVPRQPVRRTHLARATGAGHDPDAGQRTTKPTTAFVDLGYRGVDADNPDVRIVHRGKSQTDQRAREKAAQTAPGDRADHRPPQGRSPHGSLSPQG